MLNVALYNPRQHRLIPLATGTLVLARAASGTPLWVPSDPQDAEGASAVVKISPAAGGPTLAMTGCEGEFLDGHERGLADNRQLALPARFLIGDTHFEIVETPPHAPARPMERLNANRQRDGEPSSQLSRANGPAPATLTKWFAAVAALQHWATNLQELYAQAARRAVEAIGLDGAIILRRRDGEWEITSSCLPRPELGIHFDLRLLDELLQSPETLFHGRENMEATSKTEQNGNEGDSCLSRFESHAAVVISPLTGATGNVAGAVYGFRSIRDGNGRRGIRYLEANLIELLANAVSEGVARLAREAEVDQHRAMINQAFAADLCIDRRHIISEQREVTLLFADLRGFTRLANALSPEETYELLGHVMECLTAAVLDHDGMVIDYFGDGLAAMWNAPADQAEHAELACRAAVRMLEELPNVSADWAELLPTATGLRLGVGVHTGLVQVGNAGSRKRMKYGPRGANVHVAARVEGATKHVGHSLLITGATAKQLSTRFTTERVCRAALPGVDDPTDLYVVWPRANSEAPDALARYDNALKLFESGDLDSAARLLRTIDLATTSLPVEFLLNHIESALARKCRRNGDPSPSPFRGVIALNAK
jgi:adenylate cyclase